ncbi:MAG: GDSL-type esterase/lipase family protein [Bacteroidia bacterium]|nr:GDSL-type esterase/lipase family protein [Bacteroidia bacterium]
MKKPILLLIFCCVFILFANAQNEKNSLQKLNILTIGDSNGTFEYSWPQQLKPLLPNSTIINKSISGNTIGFDNLDKIELNTLKNINHYLEEAFIKIGPQNSFDFIFINLGTNDTKRIFINRQKEVSKNLSLLIQLIKRFFKDHQKQNPEICIITPSPMDELKVNVEKYGGGDLRIQKNNEQFKKVAATNKVGFLDTYTPLKNGFSEKTTDGIHLNEKAQIELATEIVNYLNKK